MDRHRTRIAPAILALVFLLSACGPAAAPTDGGGAVPTSEAVLETPAAAETAATEPEAFVPMEPAPTATDAAQAEGNAQVFTIVPEESEARFYIDEVLSGSPKTVVGVTSLVSGELHVDPEQLSQVEVGVIRIDAASLTTDNGFRNSAIKRFILQTDNFPEVLFAPKAIEGLPATAAVGDEVAFSINGDLTVRDVVKPATFEVTVRAEAANRLTGLARATVLRSDFGLTIPSVPNVANVSEEVILEFEFTASGSA